MGNLLKLSVNIAQDKKYENVADKWYDDVLSEAIVWKGQSNNILWDRFISSNGLFG